MMQFLWKYVDTLIGKGLSMDVLAQFFWYMGLILVPQALPLAILLSSLITFGNLGESSELTAIKAAGISLMQAVRSLIVFTLLVTLGSFCFQNYVAPRVNMKFAQLLVSMKQKSPELEIPEGQFYSGIPDANIYVQQKDMKTGMLYGIMVYRTTASYEDAAIILADSGMIQSTADKKHLLLTLWNGEWFENMQNSEFGNTAAVPYRRETFVNKRILLNFDSGFNMTDASLLSGNARAKSLDRISHDIDSINHVGDSIGRVYYKDLQYRTFTMPTISPADSLAVIKASRAQRLPLDTLFNRLSTDRKREVVSTAAAKIQSQLSNMEYQAMITSDSDREIRLNRYEAVNKFTLALSCLLFFFIGAPLGAIIRKGGLGVPVLIATLVFIVFLSVDTNGYRMARQGSWTVEFAKALPLAILTPLAVFVTYKSNKDSTVFNMDLYRNAFIKLLGLRIKRHIPQKEVIINTPRYAEDRERLTEVNERLKRYSEVNKLVKMPNVINVFFRYKPDHEIEQICEEMEAVIDDLANTTDKVLLTQLNAYPVMSPRAHTRPFERRWMNIAAAVLLPLGVFLYLRMWMFRLRLLRDLRVTRQTNVAVIQRTRQFSNT